HEHSQVHLRGSIGLHGLLDEIPIRGADTTDLLRHGRALLRQSQFFPGGLTLQRTGVASDSNRVSACDHPDVDVLVLPVPGVDSGHGQEVDGPAVGGGGLWVVASVDPESVALRTLDNQWDVAVVRSEPVLPCGIGNHTVLLQFISQFGAVGQSLGGPHDPDCPGGSDTLTGGRCTLDESSFSLELLVLALDNRGLVRDPDRLVIQKPRVSGASQFVEQHFRVDLRACRNTQHHITGDHCRHWQLAESPGLTGLVVPSVASVWPCDSDHLDVGLGILLQASFGQPLDHMPLGLRTEVAAYHYLALCHLLYSFSYCRRSPPSSCFGQS